MQKTARQVDRKFQVYKLTSPTPAYISAERNPALEKVYVAANCARAADLVAGIHALTKPPGTKPGTAADRRGRGLVDRSGLGDAGERIAAQARRQCRAGANRFESRGDSSHAVRRSRVDHYIRGNSGDRSPGRRRCGHDY